MSPDAISATTRTGLTKSSSRPYSMFSALISSHTRSAMSGCTPKHRSSSCIESGSEQFLRLRQDRIIHEVHQSIAHLEWARDRLAVGSVPRTLWRCSCSKNYEGAQGCSSTSMRCVAPIKPLGLIKRLNKQQCRESPASPRMYAPCSYLGSPRDSRRARSPSKQEIAAFKASPLRIPAQTEASLQTL